MSGDNADRLFRDAQAARERYYEAHERYGVSGGRGGAEGVWLDRIPYEPPIIACLECGDPLLPGEVCVRYERGETTYPLCPQCLEGKP
jgi:hypothetical protein